MISKKIKDIIRSVSDFPKKGIDFKDITPLLLNPKISDEIVNEFINKLSHINVDAIVGVESRGFLFGFLLANKMGIPFIPIRKAGKLPSKTISIAYELEYGVSEIEIHIEDIQPGWNILIHDDLLATGGTALASCQLIEEANAKIAAFAFVVSLDFLNAKDKLIKYSKNIISLVEY
jgi:adenine phosphoribosyltransferase